MMRNRLVISKPMSSEDRVSLLSTTDPEEVESVRLSAVEVLLKTCGPEVYYRGLIELSNICSRDCFYCGIRRSNLDLKRYCLNDKDIATAALWCAGQGYGSVVLQSGERCDDAFIGLIVRAIHRIKAETRCGALPDGLGITLCVGEQSRETYQRFFDAGAHRYLLRIETANPDLFARIHPKEQSFETRRDCLRILRDVGFQTGTGIMIGIPGQTIEDLAGDIDFFIDEDVDMIGMGPFIPHASTPLGSLPCPGKDRRMLLSLLMIAVTRLSIPDINIAATTALEALDTAGREQGLNFGANVLMPLLTPVKVRRDYLLYPGKPCLSESSAAFRARLEESVLKMGRKIGYNQWGDSPHVLKRRVADSG